MSEVNLNDYQQFVNNVTADPSKNLGALIERLIELEDSEMANVARLLTAASGLSSESGEFMEIIKKILFQGKPLNDDTVFHMKRELGDVLWYWAQACEALNLNPYDVIQENINKLEARYPNGFETARSEVRKANDL